MAIWLGMMRNRWYELGRTKKSFDTDWGFLEGTRIDRFCPSDFERYTGIKLKPGEIRKVKRILIELED